MDGGTARGLKSGRIEPLGTTAKGAVLNGRDTPDREGVLRILGEHLADLYATSPLESLHALDPAALAGPSIGFWTAREDSRLLGRAALKHLAPATLRSSRCAPRMQLAGAAVPRRCSAASWRRPGTTTTGGCT